MGLQEILKDVLPKGKFWTHSKQLIEGCTKVSPGCLNCWSEKACYMHSKAQGSGFSPDVFTGDKFNGSIIEHPERLMDILPRSDRRKSRVFTYWNDVFHSGVSDELRNQLFNRIRVSTDYHIICTKRPEVAVRYFRQNIRYTLNKKMIIMVTMENQDQLLARKHYALALSRVCPNVGILVEPMLSEVYISILEFKPCWIIAGMETGKGARKIDLHYANLLRMDANTMSVPFFWKSGELCGRTYLEAPCI